MSARTPGRWVARDAVRQYSDDTAFYVSVDVQTSARVTVATVEGLSEKQARANAALIAAAPETAAALDKLRDENEAAREMIRIYREDRDILLAALREIELRTRQYLDGSLIQFPGALLLQCRDAIARAEGR